MSLLISVLLVYIAVMFLAVYFVVLCFCMFLLCTCLLYFYFCAASYGVIKNDITQTGGVGSILYANALRAKTYASTQVYAPLGRS